MGGAPSRLYASLYVRYYSKSAFYPYSNVTSAVELRSMGGGGTGAVELFSYQAMVLSPEDAETKSKCPSPSTSTAKTERAPLAELTMCSVKFSIPSFSYQVTL